MTTKESSASAYLEAARLQAQHLMNDLEALRAKIGPHLNDKAYENLRDACLASIKVMKFLEDARGWQITKEKQISTKLIRLRNV